jgi:gliding motility-associated lipoprotein GldD
MKITTINKLTYILIIVVLALVGCRPDVPFPKPKGYFRLDLPKEHTYQKFEDGKFPFSFEYPTYAKLSQDTSLVLLENAPYWINVNFIDYNATIYISYKDINSKEPLEKLIDDSYRLSYKHDKKADYIKVGEFTTPNNLYGVNYVVGGNAASAHQFYFTDSAKHFVRGSLYFEVAPNADSLKPAIEFLNEDMQHLIKTFKFK